MVLLFWTYLFWYQLTKVVLEKRPVNGVDVVVVTYTWTLLVLVTVIQLRKCVGPLGI